MVLIKVRGSLIGVDVLGRVSKYYIDELCSRYMMTSRLTKGSIDGDALPSYQSGDLEVPSPEVGTDLDPLVGVGSRHDEFAQQLEIKLLE